MRSTAACCAISAAISAGWNLTAAADEAKRLIKPRVAQELGETGSALEGVFARQGYRGTLQVLESAENTGDIRQLERMSDRLGSKFRGALLLKRGARLTLRLGEFLVHVLMWLFSAALWLLWAGYALLRLGYSADGWSGGWAVLHCNGGNGFCLAIGPRWGYMTPKFLIF